MTYDIEHTGVEERSDFGQPMTMQDHHDGTHTHDIGYDIGHLISESSYQITDSPWTSPKHFYSGAGSDRSKCATARSDLLKEGRKENVPIVMSKDAFRPVEIPNTKAEKRTSSLTSLLASDFSWVSPSSRNDEKRRQQYGDSDALDSVAIHPGIGENVLNMSKVMSSGRTKRSVPIPIDDEDNSTVHRTAPPFICGESDDPDYYVHDLDSHDALGEPDSAAIGNRNYTSQNAFQSNPQIINENVHWNELRNDSAIYDSEDDETAAQSAIFRNILESQNRHMESRRIANQQAVSYDASTTPGSGLHRNASSTLLSECEVKLRAVASFNSVLPLSSRETKGMSSRKTHPPLVSAMRNKSVSSTETAVARVRVASCAAISAYSSESEDSSSDDECTDRGISRRGSNSNDASDKQEETTEMRKLSSSQRTGKCFNFDLKVQQKSMMQRMKERDRGKKKNKSGVRFLTEGEFPPVFAPTENIIPPSTHSLSAKSDNILGDNVDGIWKINQSDSMSILDSRCSSSSTLNDPTGGRYGILETVSAAIRTLFTTSLPPTTSSTSPSTSSATTSTSTSTSSTSPSFSTSSTTTTTSTSSCTSSSISTSSPTPINYKRGYV